MATGRIVEMLHAEFAQKQRDDNARLAALQLEPRISNKAKLAATVVELARLEAAK